MKLINTNFKFTVPFDMGRGAARLQMLYAIFVLMSASMDNVDGHNHSGEQGMGAPLSGVGYTSDLGAPTAEAVGLDDVHAAIAQGATGTTTVTTDITNPDVPRTVAIKNAQASGAGNVVVTGTDMNDAVVYDTIIQNGLTKVEGVVAFKTITSIVVPQLAVAGDAVVVGRGECIGLKKAYLAPGKIITAYLGGAVTVPVVATNAVTISLNTVDCSAGVYDGNKQLWVLSDFS